MITKNIADSRVVAIGILWMKEVIISVNVLFL